MRGYRRYSWVDPRVEIRNSPMGGKGSFAREPLAEGEVVTIWGGLVFTAEDVAAGRCKPGSVAGIAEGLFLADPAGAPDRDDQFLNHSCDPNLWMDDEVTLAARRDIAPGEELTIDYAMFEPNEGYVMPWDCTCGTSLCRRRVTGADWRLPELQDRYGDHFSPFIVEWIRKLSR